MYEISLVPDVKTELIRKLKVRNLVFMICVIVAAACTAVILVFVSILSGQGIALSAQDVEMQCRSEGTNAKVKKCESKFGTPILKYQNEESLLTIQNEMATLSLLNQNKVKFSRIFNILDTVRPDMARGDDNTVMISELNADFDGGSISFDGIGYSSNNIGYRALEAFKKSVNRSYYDYGSYMRYDSESESFVEIPSYCIQETTENNITYGIYKKGTPGCEAPMVDENDKKVETNSPSALQTPTDLTVDNQSQIVIDGEDVTATDETTTAVERKDIKIRRTYVNEKDKNEYINGNDRLANGDGEIVKNYYFESKCIQYDSDGKFSESDTLESCPLLSDEIVIGDTAYGRDDDGKMALSFSTTLPISREVLLAANKHMMVIAPTRQNVTDSYIQIHDMFASAIEKTDEEVK